jgi:hypothetical protein
MLQCVTCGGTYEPLQDNVQYFHTCPPLSAAEIARGLADGSVRLARADQAQLDAARTLDQAEPLPAGSATREQQLLATLLIERPNRRDENVTGEMDPQTRRAAIKAEGGGTRPARLP